MKYYYSDGTASSKYDGSKVLHREDGPAVELANGARGWYINGKLHREDGPAVEDANGTRAWWRNGKNHRDDGPAVEYANGHRAWYINDHSISILTKKQLIKYMEVNNLTIAHLLTDSDELVRTSAAKCDWK